MKPRVLIIVTGDPRTSPRPSEAVRIAAGVGAWQKVEIAVYLRGEAVRMLGEPPAGLVDEEDFFQYWPILAEFSQPVYAQKNAAALRELGRPAMAFKKFPTANWQN